MDGFTIAAMCYKTCNSSVCEADGMLLGSSDIHFIGRTIEKRNSRHVDTRVQMLSNAVLVNSIRGYKHLCRAGL